MENTRTTIIGFRWFKKFIIFSFIFLSSCSTSVKVSDLTCEYRTHPIAIESGSPHFSWRMQGRNRGLHQTGYRLVVADNRRDIKRKQGTVWDSGEQWGDSSLMVSYGGAPLQPGRCYYWKVGILPSPYRIEGSGQGNSIELL